MASSAPDMPGGIPCANSCASSLGDESDGGELDVGEPVLVADLVVVGDQHRPVLLARDHEQVDQADLAALDQFPDRTEGAVIHAIALESDEIQINRAVFELRHSFPLCRVFAD